MYNLDFIKFKNFCSLKHTVKKKRSATEWEEILAIYISDEVLISRVYLSFYTYVRVINNEDMFYRHGDRQTDQETEKMASPKILVGLSRWYNGWESTCQCRGRGFNPWSGKISHAEEPLRPCATTTRPTLWAQKPQLLKPTSLEPVPHNKGRRCNEKPTHRKEE